MPLKILLADQAFPAAPLGGVDKPLVTYNKLIAFGLFRLSLVLSHITDEKSLKLYSLAIIQILNFSKSQ